MIILFKSHDTNMPTILKDPKFYFIKKIQKKIELIIKKKYQKKFCDYNMYALISIAMVLD